MKKRNREHRSLDIYRKLGRAGPHQSRLHPRDVLARAAHDLVDLLVAVPLQEELVGARAAAEEIAAARAGHGRLAAVAAHRREEACVHAGGTDALVVVVRELVGDVVAHAALVRQLRDVLHVLYARLVPAGGEEEEEEEKKIVSNRKYDFSVSCC